MALDNTTKWIQEVLVPRILKNDDFRGATIEKTEVREMENMKDNWASDLYEINLLLRHQGYNKPMSFILKLMCEDEKVRMQMQSEKQFSNEIYFYSTVVPLFSSHATVPHLKAGFEKLFPECYYSYFNKVKKSHSFEDAVLVMENVKLRGFQLGDRTALDMNHLSLSLQCLGSFHAFSYFMKEHDYGKFMNMLKPILETTYESKFEDTTNKVFSLSERRVMNALAAELPEDDPRLVKLQDIALRNPFDIFSDRTQPREPLAVLCHGDFLRNNLLFRYDNEEPVEMKFVDFQTIRYASPTIDLSSFICMNTNHEQRGAHFIELLQIYHKSLTDTLAALFGKPKDHLDDRYSFESFLADFRHHALYGYLVAIEFLPWMFAESDELAVFVKLMWEEKCSPRYNEVAYRLGGDEATRAIVNLTLDLLEHQCL